MARSMQDQVAVIIGELGFITQKVDFDSIIRGGELKSALKDEHPASAVAEVLMHMPHLFVLHPRVDPIVGALFVNILMHGEVVNEAARQAYDKYYPEAFIAIRVIPTEDLTRLSAHWMHESPDTAVDLADFVEEHVGIRIPATNVEFLRDQGFDIRWSS